MPDPVFLSGDAVPDYLRGVELMTAGMGWPGMNGPATVTMQNLADAVAAADDPHIQPPRIKLGHTSSLNGDHPDFNPFAAIGDAEPAFGQFTNLRLTNDGAVLVGDATNVPVWLAEMAPAAYPNRSAEAPWEVESPQADVQTAGGKRYSMVVTAVSLLGVYLPAIQDLEDLSTLIMDGPSALAASQTPAALAAGAGSALSISEDEIRQRFNFDWAMDAENGADEDTYWWWCREVRVSEGEIIADDDEGHLWMVPFTDADGVTTFGEPGEVRKTYIPVAASVSQVACFARPSKPQRPPVAAGTTPAAIARPDQGVNMDDDVREFLVARGIDPEKATDVQINAASVLMAEQPAEAEAEPPEADEPVAEVEQEAPVAERVPVAAARVPDGMSLIDSATLAELKAGAADGTRLAREKATETRDRVLAAARDEGRFPPSRLAAYSKMYDADPDGTTVLLTADEDKGGLAKGAVPLAARAQTPDPESAAFAVDQPLPAGVSILSPSERAESRARRSA